VFQLGVRKELAIILVMMLCGIFIYPAEVLCEFYKYVDKDGKIFYVDDLSKVPPEYQDQIQTYREKYDHLPADQRTTARQKDQEIERERELEHQRQIEQELQRVSEQEAAEKLRQAQEARDQMLETKVVIEGNRILVPVTLVNHGSELETLMLLDTGASQMVIQRDIADQLNVATLRKGLSQVAGGQTIQTEMGQLSYMKVGPIKMLDPIVIIINHEGAPVKYKGLLGMNFLRNVQYSIDYQNQVIKWIPSGK
jgi:predicted aspartyl protease